MDQSSFVKNDNISITFGSVNQNAALNFAYTQCHAQIEPNNLNKYPKKRKIQNAEHKWLNIPKITVAM